MQWALGWRNFSTVNYFWEHWDKEIIKVSKCYLRFFFSCAFLVGSSVALQSLADLRTREKQYSFMLTKNRHKRKKDILIHFLYDEWRCLKIILQILPVLIFCIRNVFDIHICFFFKGSWNDWKPDIKSR